MYQNILSICSSCVKKVYHKSFDYSVKPNTCVKSYEAAVYSRFYCYFILLSGTNKNKIPRYYKNKKHFSVYYKLQPHVIYWSSS